MTAILRSESRRLQRSSVVLVVVFALLSVLYFSMFPELGGEEAEELFEAFPEAMFDLFGIEAIHTIEGFIAAEVYSFFWVILLGIYFAYVGAGMIAGDIEDRKMDLTLANPVSRESVLVQKIAAFWVPLVVLNTVVPVIVYVGSRLIEEPIDGVAIAMVHLLSVPYLLVCAGIGILLSVVIDRKRTAQSTALGLVFVLWLIEGTSNMASDYEWVGYFTPSRYYDETAILVREEYAFLDAAILLSAFLLLVLLAVGIFVRRDI
ncbi:ABC-type transport system involved in multi-copper enzyme maturation, permease component [Halalkaliarchaeum sp. AArc-CO]|uniref:ABC transporter permease n=1 Tax=unclassified Halalkaliarchaeum TaxID=2678344 RepID=UPI00217D92E2|nr:MULTISPECIES: ABC transporter permease [unclassified Halalkaliarchaeum]MDR5674575.1 ABC transporter permease [Halalkaliarchaeum sp. AArc-GB]UWG49490.1 ABC-type transport system involved in multi-copper enzyme maturation, permease component [Halalkaliarchaeum sp. AArc-CO]